MFKSWSDVKMFINRHSLPYSLLRLRQGAWLVEWETGRILTSLEEVNAEFTTPVVTFLERQ